MGIKEKENKERIEGRIEEKENTIKDLKEKYNELKNEIENQIKDDVGRGWIESDKIQLLLMKSEELLNKETGLIDDLKKLSEIKIVEEGGVEEEPEEEFEDVGY